MAAYDLDTVANVKVYMGIASTDATQDTLLQTLISNVSLGIEGYLDRKIVVQTITEELLCGTGTNRLYPKYTPVYGPSTTAHWESDLFYRDTLTGSWVAIEDDDEHAYLKSDDPSFIELYEEVFPWSGTFANIKISYKAGYNPVPGDLMLTFYEMVQRAFDESKAGKNQLAVQSIGDTRSSISTTFKDMQPKWEKVLNRYKRLV
jgi:hypothetical protein